MVRRARVEYPGAVYHVIQRGNNRENVFGHPENKDFLTAQLGKSVAVDGIELFAYAVMSNHYHLALRTSTEPLTKVMHRINTRYGQYYNRSTGRTGHVFEGRYKAIPVNDEKYLVALVRYIHRNPVRVGICSDISQYPWTSDRFYRQMEPGIVDVELLLEMLSGDRRKAVAKYRSLMEQEDDYNPKELNIDSGGTSEGKNREKNPARKTLDEILTGVGVSPEDYDIIKKGSRLRRLSKAKEAYAKNAWELGYSMEQIARHISISSVAVFKYINK